MAVKKTYMYWLLYERCKILDLCLKKNWYHGQELVSFKKKMAVIGWGFCTGILISGYILIEKQHVDFTTIAGFSGYTLHIPVYY